MNLYTVTGDHPLFGRPDMFHISRDVAIELVRVLDECGYENIKLEQENRPPKVNHGRMRAKREPDSVRKKPALF